MQVLLSNCFLKYFSGQGRGRPAGASTGQYIRSVTGSLPEVGAVFAFGDRDKKGPRFSPRASVDCEPDYIAQEVRRALLAKASTFLPRWKALIAATVLKWS